RGLGAGKATLCCASPAIPHAESIPSTNPNSIGSTTSEVVRAPADRHRVTFAALRRNVPVNVDEMQKKLSQKAEKEQEHQFENLYGMLCNEGWLRVAAHTTLQN